MCDSSIGYVPPVAVVKQKEEVGNVNGLSRKVIELQQDSRNERALLLSVESDMDSNIYCNDSKNEYVLVWSKDSPYCNTDTAVGRRLEHEAVHRYLRMERYRGKQKRYHEATKGWLKSTIL